MLSREERILTELLLSRAVVSAEVVERCAAVAEASSPRVALADVLVSSGGVTPDEAARASAEARDIARALAPELGAGVRLGEFRIVRELGRGGMGIVFEAEQETLRRRVALKVLPSGSALDERAAIRFLREARATARLDHPGIVRVLTSGRAEGVLYFAMELVEGRSLDAEIARGPLEPRRAARIAAEVARALAHAHAAGLVHRDVKPGNVILDADDRAHVTDFGLVHDMGEGSVTLSRHVLGTPAYMSPEQARSERVDARSDVHGVGATLFTMLAGRPPHEGAVPAVVLARLLSEDTPDLGALRPDLPAGIVATCRRAMAKRPAERHPTALALAEDLEKFLSGVPRATLDAALPATGTELALASARRRRLGWAIGGLLIATLTGALALVSRRPESSESTGGERRVAAAGESDPCVSEHVLTSGMGDGAAWTLVRDPDAETVEPRPVRVATAPADETSLAGAEWVAAEAGGPGGEYAYARTFCLPAGFTEPNLTLEALGDEILVAAFLNDARLDAEAGLPPERLRVTVTDPSLFHAGTNVLEVHAFNLHVGFTGLAVRGVATSGAPAPGARVPVSLPGSLARGARVKLAPSPPGRKRGMALSAEGRGLACATLVEGRWRVHVKDTWGTEGETLLPDDPEGHFAPAFAPDGQRMAILQASGPVVVFDGITRTARALPPVRPRPMAWSPDGREIAVSVIDTSAPDAGTGSGVSFVAMRAAAGDWRKLADVDAYQPSWSPDGRWVAFRQERDGQSDLWVVPGSGGGEAVALTRDAPPDHAPTWSSDGDAILFASERAGVSGLWSLGVDASAGRAVGTPRLVLPWFLPEAVDLSASRDRRRLAVVPLADSVRLYRVTLAEADALAERAAGVRGDDALRSATWVDVSPDGRALAVTTGGERADLAVMVAGGLVRLTDDDAADLAPRWSPDGKRIAFHSDATGSVAIHVIDAAGAGRAVVIRTPPDGATHPCWAPDGQRLACSVRGLGGAIAPVTEDGGADLQPLPSPPEGGGAFEPWDWSPDGKALAGTAEGIVVLGLETGEWERLTRFGRRPRWLPGERLLFAHREALWVVERRTRLAWQVFGAQPARVGECVSVSRDGRVAACPLVSSAEDIWVLELPDGFLESPGDEPAP